MTNDFRLNIAFFRHLKTMRLGRDLGEHGVVSLLRLWAFAAEQRPDGSLSDMNDHEIELAAGWNGTDGMFAKVLREAGFLDKDGSLHDWHTHNGYVAATAARSKHMRRLNHDRALKRRCGVCGVAKCEFCVVSHSTEHSTEHSTDDSTDTVTDAHCSRSTAVADADADADTLSVTTAEARRLAGLLLDLHRERDPKFRPAQARTRTVNSWAKDIELLIRRDERAPGEVEAVIRFVVADSFWQTNVLSGAKLREKFDQLVAKAQAATKTTRSASVFDLPDVSVIEAEREAARRAIEPQTGILQDANEEDAS